MKAKDDKALRKHKGEFLRDLLVMSIWVLASITLVGSILCGLLLWRIGGTTRWTLPNAPAEHVEIYSKEQIDKLVTSILIAVQNQPIGGENAQADMVFIASFHALEQRLTMVALASEMVLNVEGHGKKTLGETYALGGPSLLINTINQNFDLDLQKYACTDTNALAAMLDLLGGAQIEITTDEAGYINDALVETGVNIQPGTVTLTGIESMVYTMYNGNAHESLSNLQRSLTLIQAVVSSARKSATKEAMLPLLSLVFSSIKTNLTFETLRELGYEILKAEEMEYGNMCLPCDESYHVSGLKRDKFEIDIPRNGELLRETLYKVSTTTE